MAHDQIFTSKECKFNHYGLVSYRIEIDLSMPLRPLQRHIWTRDDGTEEVQEWILSAKTTASNLVADGWSQIKPSA